MKTLLVMRHGKSDWDADYDSDHERPLNQRGVRSARAMGKALTEDAAGPDLVVTSSAVRARTTAQLAADAGAWDCEIRIEPRLYGSSVDGVVQVATESGNAERVMLVGHQPTWSILVTTLTGEQVEMKTATIAVIEFEMSDWSDVAATHGTLARVYQPRDYLG